VQIRRTACLRQAAAAIAYKADKQSNPADFFAWAEWVAATFTARDGQGDKPLTTSRII
jgi:hypothetical protein